MGAERRHARETQVSDAAQARVLAIMGSGETSPTMVTIHKALVARLGTSGRTAVLLATPYAFQENANDISARSQSYFARSVDLKVDAVRDADLPVESNPDAPGALVAIRSADWVFCGPGSPSYALSKWRGGPVADALRERIAAGGGITVIASAAAAAIGFVAVPVYEIYKAGADPHWLEGLDLFGVLGLKVAVIPHYDNNEGGTHDTRFCYLGERRLRILERELPEDAAVLGVDEHTALIFDLATEQAEVAGRGGATVRKAGVSTVLPAGSRITLAELRDMVRTAARGRSADPGDPARRHVAGGPNQPCQASDAGQPGGALNEVTTAAQGRFDAAEQERDSASMVTAILDLEAAIEAWSTDTDENDDSDRASVVLRGLVVRLGQTAKLGLVDPADRLRPAVEPLIALRDALRKDRSYQQADLIRDALATAGVDLRDSPDGTSWELTAAG
jgi:cyanophycinase-like exopeptidase